MHLPAVLREQELPILNEALFNEKSYKMLKTLAEYILGGTETPDALIDMLNWQEQFPDPWKTQITSVCEKGMKSLCTYKGLEIPSQFIVAPLNSTALLSHWRVLSIILSYLSEEQRDQFHKLGSNEPVPRSEGQLPSTLAKEGEEGDETVSLSDNMMDHNHNIIHSGTTSDNIEGEVESDVQNNTTNNSRDEIMLGRQDSRHVRFRQDDRNCREPATDSHFHVDRMRRMLGRQYDDMPFEELISQVSTIEPARKVNLIGGVTVYQSTS